MRNSEFHQGPNAFSGDEEWTEQEPRSVLWVEAFVLHWFQILQGPGEVDDVVDRAFGLYANHGGGSAEDAARAEFETLQRSSH